MKSHSFIKKLSALVLGGLMAIGVGIGLDGNSFGNGKVEAGTTTTVTYTVTGKTAVSTTGTAPTGSSASYTQTYNTAKQATSGNSMTLTLTGYAGNKINGITLSMHANASKGAGTLSVTAGSTSIAGISTTTNFNSWYNNTSYGSTFRDVNVDITNNAYEIQKNESVIIHIACTTNSLYCESYAITYEKIIHVTGISLNESMKLSVGASATLNPTIEPSDATNKSVTWSSNNTSVATVDENGKVSGVSAGKATITVTSKDNTSKTDTCEVTITNPVINVTSISFSISSISLVVGNTYHLVPTISPDNATDKSVVWISNDESIATVDDLGVITGVKAGNTVVTAVTNDGELEASCSIEVVSASSYDYTCIFKLNENEIYMTQYLSSSECIEKPLDPTKSGMIFDYWYDIAGDSNTAFDFANSSIEHDVVLMARFVSNYFDENNTAFEPKFSLGYSYEYNSNTTVDDNPFGSVSFSGTDDLSGYDSSATLSISNGTFEKKDFKANKIDYSFVTTVNNCVISDVTEKVYPGRLNSVKLGTGTANSEGYGFSVKSDKPIFKISFKYLNTSTSNSPDLLINNKVALSKIDTHIKDEEFEFIDYSYFFEKSVDSFSIKSTFALNIKDISIYSGTKTTTYSNCAFKMRLAIPNMDTYVSTHNNNSENVDITDCGIKLVLNSNTRLFSFSETSKTYTDSTYNMTYVVISLGDVLNNISRATDEFTICAYFKIGETEYSSSQTKTYSLAKLVKKYHDTPSLGVNVDGLYKTLADLGVDFSKIVLD